MNCAAALITGGAGFLGGYLCERLLAEGVEVVCVDDLSTSTPDAVCVTTRAVSSSCTTSASR